jgi:hypothetical protein
MQIFRAVGLCASLLSGLLLVACKQPEVVAASAGTVEAEAPAPEPLSPADSRARCELPGADIWSKVVDAATVSWSVYFQWARFPDRGDGQPDIYPPLHELQDELPAGWQHLDHFLGTYQSRGFASLSSHDGVCYLAFKGTEDPGDLLRDAESYFLTDCTTREGVSFGRCGRGFQTILGALRSEDGDGSRGLILDRVRDWQDAGACPGGVVATGHSLGGALADVFAAHYLAETGRRVSIISFAAPRVFAADTAAALQETLGAAKLRIVRRGDLVPSFPPRGAGFEHFGQVFELSQGAFSNLGEWFLQAQPVTWQSLPGPYHFMAQYREGVSAACSREGNFDPYPPPLPALTASR